MKISEVTERHLDALFVTGSPWAGRLRGNLEFFAEFTIWKVFRPMTTVSIMLTLTFGNILSITITRQGDWILYDSRFDLLRCEDESLLRFLCETIHPVVETNTHEAEGLLQMYNSYLKNDGFQIIEKSRISGKPVFVGHYIGVVTTPGVTAVRGGASWRMRLTSLSR